MNIFIAGPDCGLEFGWLVATWIPAVRCKARGYDKTIIVGKPGHQALYEFASDYYEYTKSGNCDRWLLNGNICHTPKFLKQNYPDAKFWYPDKRICMNKPREYYKYGQNSEAKGYDLLLHARACSKYGQSNINWGLKNYIKLVEEFDDVKIASIGSMSGAHHVPGTDDLRGVPLSLLVGVMANAQCVVGTSSGPLHLASHCGCPHVVITYDKGLKILGGKNNRYRYEKLWNPFKTPVSVIDKWGWHPPVEPVIKATGKYL